MDAKEKMLELLSQERHALEMRNQRGVGLESSLWHERMNEKVQELAALVERHPDVAKALLLDKTLDETFALTLYYALGRERQAQWKAELEQKYNIR